MRKRQVCQSCEHLGLACAPEHHLDRPSIDHRCYLWDQGDMVDLSHQENHCLSGRSAVCPWLQIKPAGRTGNAFVRRPALAAGIGATIAVVFLSALMFKAAANNWEPATESQPAASNAAVAAAEPGVTPARRTPTLGPQGQASRQPSSDTGKSPPSPATGASISGPPERRLETSKITTLADGSSEAVLTYEQAGTKTINVSIPSSWNLGSAQLDIEGKPYAVETTDQKNEARNHDSTWGVRAQQFRPAGDVLTSVDLFLARTSSRPGDLTVQIREDDGRGYPSAKVLTSVTKAVAVGDYRWEEFDFPAVPVTPGRPYWIVNYVKALGEVAYPETPSVGDYGYYLGMSLDDEYPPGGSADFLTFQAGSRWEKFDSRSGWDLMFRTRTQRRYFPTGLHLRVGADGEERWSYLPELKSKVSSVDLSVALKDYLLAGRGSGEENVQVPISVESGSAGVVRISNLQITGTHP